jgi:hypothetical protein
VISGGRWTTGSRWRSGFNFSTILAMNEVRSDRRMAYANSRGIVQYPVHKHQSAVHTAPFTLWHLHDPVWQRILQFLLHPSFA